MDTDAITLSKIERCPPALQQIVEEFREASPRERLDYLLEYAYSLPELPPGFPSDEELKQNWPKFRGPDGSGIAAGGSYPTKWDVRSGAGVAWKTEVPLPGSNSPIGWGCRASRSRMRCISCTGRGLCSTSSKNRTGSTS